jgi:hypothetical protein
MADAVHCGHEAHLSVDGYIPAPQSQRAASGTARWRPAALRSEDVRLSEPTPSTTWSSCSATPGNWPPALRNGCHGTIAKLWLESGPRRQVFVAGVRSVLPDSAEL